MKTRLCLVLLSLVAVNGFSELLDNGTFETGTLSSWTTGEWDGDGKSEIASSVESTDPLNGSYSAKIDIAANSDGVAQDAYVLNFYQDISVTSGRYYPGRFTVRASQSCSFYIQMYKPNPDYETFAYQQVDAGTEPQIVNFGGTAAFTTVDASTVCRVMFNLGQVAPGTTIWLDDLSVTETTPALDTAAVSVDFAQQEDVASMSGFLLGVDSGNVVSGNPDDQYVNPLQPAWWRVNWNTNYTARVAGYGATPIVLVSEGKYPGWDTNNIANPAPWSDGYVSWSNHCVSVAQTHGSNVVYDIWNEPDITGFFLSWPGADFEKFLETFKVAHDAIRSVEPAAPISGPSLSASWSPPRLTQFMEFCKTNSLTVQVLSLHMLDRDDAALGQMEADIMAVRSNYLDNALYASVGVEEIHVNEFLGNTDQWLRPGSILAFMRSMEIAGVDAACRSAWTNPDSGSNSAFDGSLDGVLTGTSRLPRAAWWAHKWYADGAESRVSASSDNGEVAVLASRSSSTNNQAQILIASRGYTGSAQDMSSVTLSLTNLSDTGFIPANATNMSVSIHRVSFSGDGSVAVSAPDMLASSMSVAVSNDAAQITLSDLNAYDAQLITLSRATVLKQSTITRFTVADTLLVQNDNNYGASTGLQLSGNDGANNRYAMFKFDLSAVDVDNIINAVLYVKNANASAAAQDLFTTALYPVGNNPTWEEGTGTATFNANASSWYWADKINVSFNLNRWSKLSGANAGNIEDGAVLGSVIAAKTTTGALVWGEMVPIQLDASLLKNFVASNGMVTLAVNSTAPTAGALNIFSREHAQGNTYLEMDLSGYPFVAWVEDYELSGNDALETADPDSDGYSNLLEFAFGGNPTNGADAGHVPSWEIVEDGETRLFGYAYAFRVDEGSGLTYTLQGRDSLISGDWVDEQYQIFGTGILNDDLLIITNRFMLDSAPRHFFRLSVTRQ